MGRYKKNKEEKYPPLNKHGYWGATKGTDCKKWPDSRAAGNGI